MLTFGFTRDKNSGLLGECPVFDPPIYTNLIPPQTLLLFIQPHRISFFAPVIITMATRGYCLTIDVNMGGFKQLTQVRFRFKSCMRKDTLLSSAAIMWNGLPMSIKKSAP